MLVFNFSHHFLNYKFNTIMLQLFIEGVSRSWLVKEFLYGPLLSEHLTNSLVIVSPPIGALIIPFQLMNPS